MVKNALLDWLDLHNYLPDQQFGFRPKRSVAMALTCAQADWAAAKRKSEAVAIIAFNFSAAFDYVSLGPITQKLEAAGIHGTPLKWVQNYMSDRSQSVIWNDTTSKPINLQYGVPQGSILGPLLFLMMVADLPEFVTKDSHKDVTVNIMSCADDCTLYASAKSVALLQKNLESMSDRIIIY